MRTIRTVAFLALLCCWSFAARQSLLATNECISGYTHSAYGGQNPARRAEDGCNAMDCDLVCAEHPCYSSAIDGDWCSDGAVCGTWEGYPVYCSSGLCHCTQVI
jgi:hypothetical protein